MTCYTAPAVGGALSRVTVVDLTTVRSGPTCTKILADFGAEVMRIERPGDVGRDRVYFDQADLHRNKKSAVVNLQDPRGVAIVRALAARADVMVENYRPDVKHRLGVDWATLSADNPRLVYASVSGFGQEGPYRDRPGYDQIVQGMSGLMSLTGTAAVAPHGTHAATTNANTTRGGRRIWAQGCGAAESLVKRARARGGLESGHGARGHRSRVPAARLRAHRSRAQAAGGHHRRLPRAALHPGRAAARSPGPVGGGPGEDPGLAETRHHAGARRADLRGAVR
ncbi:MAG: hypothetical protein DMD82_04165 [Candidatus Rokuibacteriota bacterium]|nr:MAG: hypothetical protein DMD82_04165 [Candidatus Rokubacteria bacterium]